VTGYLEVTTGPIWHQVNLAAALTNQTAYFNVARGANRSLTNMVQAGQLPGAVAFRCRKIAFEWTPEIAMADVFLLWEGELELQVGNKTIFEARVSHLPAGGGVTGVSDIGAAAPAQMAWANGVPGFNAMATLKEPILIKGGQNFGAVINWGAGVTPSAITPTIVTLWGEFFRPI
jgi:hypothetical protein